MKALLVALLSYYAGVVAPVSLSPFVIVGLLVLVVAIGWANLLEIDPRDRPVKYVAIPVARARRSS